MKCDVAIVGGGPAGSMLGSFLKRWSPQLEVAIFERERFPREHVGESLLPMACTNMQEVGVWDKIEAQLFPIKLGANYRWGMTPEIIDFTFLPNDDFQSIQRPSPYAGQRVLTAFQVDRSVFDTVLLDHAEEMGCSVFQETRVQKVDTDGDRVVGLQTDSETVEAKHYVDASGVNGVLRRAFDVPVAYPTALKNIAIWDYWQNADWAIEEGVGGTYIQVMSLGWGWIWFISIRETRTSVGVVTPIEYFKNSGLSREEIYLKAISEEPRITKMLENATRENKLQSVRDWSYVADRLVGENWFLAGDSCGFADPILSAGITLATSGSKRVAYSISELERGDLDPSWVRAEYDRIQRLNIQNHIRFADYWYSANAKFSDLVDYCSEIARHAGLSLNSADAFRWISTGGFTDDLGFEQPASGSYRLSALKNTIFQTSGEKPGWEISKYNHLTLNLEGAERTKTAIYRDGRVQPMKSYRRGVNTLLIERMYKFAYLAIAQEPWVTNVIKRMKTMARRHSEMSEKELDLVVFEVLEAMIAEGWIKGAAVAAPGSQAKPAV